MPLRKTKAEIRTYREERLEKRRTNQKEIVAFMHRRGSTTQNEIKEMVGSIAGLNELIDMKVVLRNPKHFRLTLAE